MKKYNPNQAVRQWSMIPLIFIAAFIIVEVFTITIGWGGAFGRKFWVLYLMFLLSLLFSFFTYRTFPVYYVNEQLQIFYAAIYRKKRLKPGTVVSIEPIAGRVNLFFRPRGFSVLMTNDGETFYRVYIIAGDTKFEQIITQAFPGRLKPEPPGTSCHKRH